MSRDPRIQEPETPWISFDSTLSVPVYMPGFLMTRPQFETLFHEDCGAEVTWEPDGSRGFIQLDGWDPMEAETLNLTVIEGVNYYSFTSAPFEWNNDDETMEELGWTAKWEPGVGLVPVPPPFTAANVAVDRLWERAAFGKWSPLRVNSWIEYAEQQHEMDEVFQHAGIDPADMDRRATVAASMDMRLREWADTFDTEGTVRADELEAGMLVNREDVEWHGRHPRETVSEILRVEPVGNAMVAITIHKYMTEHVQTVRADRRFRKA